MNHNLPRPFGGSGVFAFSPRRKASAWLLSCEVNLERDFASLVYIFALCLRLSVGISICHQEKICSSTQRGFFKTHGSARTAHIWKKDFQAHSLLNCIYF